MNTTSIQYIPRAALTPSTLNPRKHFNEERIAELRANIAKNGILSPLIVRPEWCVGAMNATELRNALHSPAPIVEERYEIVCGECRWRATEGLTEIGDLPTMVRALSDPEVEEINLAEQIGRNELTPLEEARSFKRLLAYKREDGTPLHTAATLAASVGRVVSFVHGRLQLLEAPENIATALADGKIATDVALYVARIPDKEMRKEAGKTILNGGNGGEPMTARAAREYIQQNFMKELKGAPFDREDKTLVPEAGPCSTCPHRTGNNKAAFGDVQRGDVCTKPGCYAAKQTAAFARVSEEAKAKGQIVLSGTEAEKVYPKFQPVGQMSWESPYVLIGERPAEHLLKSVVKKAPTYRELVEKMQAAKMQPKVYLIPDQAGVAKEHVVLEQIVTAAPKVGEPIFREKSGGGLPVKEDAATARIKEEKERAKEQLAVSLVVLTDLWAAMRKDWTPSGVWEVMQIIALARVGGDGAWLLGKWQGLKLEGQHGWVAEVAKWYRKLEGIEASTAVPLLLVADEMRHRGIAAAGVVELAEEFGVDLKAIEKRVHRIYREKLGASIEPEKTPAPPAAKPAAAADAKTGGKKVGAGEKAAAAVKASMKPKPAKKAAKSGKKVGAK